MTTLLTIDEVFLLHAAALEKYGGSPGLRDRGLLESALAQPLATFSGKDLYPTIWDKVAALGRSIVQNHSFVDGNKRVGFAAMAVALGRNGYDLICTPEEGEELILSILTQGLDRDALAKWLQEHCTETA